MGKRGGTVVWASWPEVVAKEHVVVLVWKRKRPTEIKKTRMSEQIYTTTDCPDHYITLHNFWSCLLLVFFLSGATHLLLSWWIKSSSERRQTTISSVDSKSKHTPPFLTQVLQTTTVDKPGSRHQALVGMDNNSRETREQTPRFGWDG